jgi:hypothetical protein
MNIHTIPLGSIVELLPFGTTPEEDYNEHTGLRLFVVEHTKDCDGSSMYSLSMFNISQIEEKKRLFSSAALIIDNFSFNANTMLGCTLNGYTEENLRVIK